MDGQMFVFAPDTHSVIRARTETEIETDAQAPRLPIGTRDRLLKWCAKSVRLLTDTFTRQPETPRQK